MMVVGSNLCDLPKLIDRTCLKLFCGYEKQKARYLDGTFSVHSPLRLLSKERRRSIYDEARYDSCGIL